MNREELIKITITFATLFAVSLGMIVSAYRVAHDELQQVLIPVASGILGGALAFYLVQMFELERGSRR